jgi:hypothetical protein
MRRLHLVWLVRGGTLAGMHSVEPERKCLPGSSGTPLT